MRSQERLYELMAAPPGILREAELLP